ncbi:hypothetical protein HYN48_11210 [Flavobacterium magnum]|uniref:histidine kinase n=1 Tax=Flavobacterium magnum TaxID=2162713 RepID=A0A2S0RH48_9FLAO|nr:ATP-binding protein [Flavobacterium magnum]AWA30610.1 hypothetical protein HYN48_11210 [Flavobacterium magnum]
MKFPGIFRFQMLLRLVLCVLVIAIGYLTTKFYFQMTDLSDSVKTIENSNAVRFELEHISSAVNKNESALRSFIISRDSLYLRDRQLEKEAFAIGISRLQKLSLKNPEFSSGIDSLTGLLHRWDSAFENTFRTVAHTKYDNNKLNFNLLKSITYSDNLQDFTNKLINTQQYKIRGQEQYHSDKISESSWTAGILAILSLVVFLLAYAKMNADVVSLKKSARTLSENNLKLVQINAELESFNSIVSHDMQEPLRKIQMFISRLDGNETQHLSDQGKNYFARIRMCANRMQNLMIDLVNYSRAVKGDRPFVKIDLNLLMREVVDELSLDIEEKKAVITIGSLPVIDAIPFQIQQLFVNLLSNSIKYSKKGVPPEINISQEPIAEHVSKNGKKINDSGFIKIVVADNGIGFRQEYAENIFMLFRRLETELTYSGTGLGLAICKKIAENHNGFISAFGKENEGAAFHIYLPK